MNERRTHGQWYGIEFVINPDADDEFDKVIARKWPGRDAEHIRPDGSRSRRGKNSQYEASIWERMCPTKGATP